MPLSMNYDAPCASTEEDLPGFIPFKKNSAPRRYSTLTRAWNDICTSLVLIFLISQLIVVEGCLPSWFRQERTEPQSLETNQSITNEIEDPPEVVETAYSTKEIHEHRHTPHQRTVIEVTEDTNEIEELDMIYGTAAPIRMDNKLEEARRHHSKRKCKGWCYRGGNCTVDIDEVTYQLRSINCHCPHGYWGRRCELHFVARLFAPVKGQVEVEKSGVSAFAFIILMLIVTIGLIFYTYRKIVRRNVPFNSTTLLSLNHHLRRPTTMSFQAMPNAVVNTTPSSSAAYLNRCSTSQHFNCRTPFSPLSRSYGQFTGNSHQSFSNLTPSLSMAFGRLSLSSNRLHQHPNMRPFKFLGRSSSCTAHPVNDTIPSPNHSNNQTTYYTVMSRLPSDQSMNVEERRYDGQRSATVVQAPVTVHESPQ